MTKYFAQAYRDMAYVPRWAIIRKNRQQNLAEHSYYAAVYSLHIGQMIGWRGNYANLLIHALYHDIDETVSGDIPGPYKRTAVDKTKGQDTVARVMAERFGKDVLDVLSGVDPEVKRIVSAADAAEELCYLIEEIRLGNSWVKPLLPEVKARLRKRWLELPAVPRVLTETWKEASELLWDGQFEDPITLKDLS